MDVKTERICGIDYPKDVVIVHKFGRGKTGPGVGHFDVKLQTYLRVNKIPYQKFLQANSVDPDETRIMGLRCLRMPIFIDTRHKWVKYICVLLEQSEVKEDNHLTAPKKKTPWIEYNGITMGDSQMVIEFLNKEYKVDMNRHLTKQEKAIAWAIQKWIEEFMYWLNVHSRWVIFSDETFEEGIPPFPMEEKSSVRQWVSAMTYTAGVGRHSNDEVQDMVVENLRYFSDVLGEKNFIMGDKMSVVDCAAFGILSQMRWQTPSVCQGRKLLNGGEISNVTKYLDRIRDQYWPDYDSPTC